MAAPVSPRTRDMATQTEPPRGYVEGLVHAIVEIVKTIFQKIYHWVYEKVTGRAFQASVVSAPSGNAQLLP